MDSTEIFDPDYDLWQLFSYTHRLVTSVSDNKLRRYKLTRSTIGVLTLLSILDHNPTPIEIARSGKTTPQTVTVILKRMEKQGFVSRAIDQNKKNSYKISLTEKGRIAIHIINSVDIYKKVMANLSEEQRQQLRDCLHKIIVSANNYC